MTFVPDSSLILPFGARQSEMNLISLSDDDHRGNEMVRWKGVTLLLDLMIIMSININDIK